MSLTTSLAEAYLRYLVAPTQARLAVVTRAAEARMLADLTAPARRAAAARARLARRLNGR